MNDVKELLRLPSPAPLPQSLAFDGEKLWMGSRETRRIYTIDPHAWTAHDETQAPGTPWGLTVTGDELRVLCGVGETDDRFIYRFAPGHGFHPEDRIACPDDTGSYLGYDGSHLIMTQWYRKKMLTLTDSGTVIASLDIPHGICGCVIADGHTYLITTDNEESTDYWLTRVEITGGKTAARDVARIPFAARSLAYDGERFWTNHRAANEIVAFTAAA